MKTIIHKYILNDTLEIQEIEMPATRFILDFQMQFNREPIPKEELVIWVMFPITVGERLEKAKFQLTFTGYEFEHSDRSSYVGTAQKLGLSYHLFEVNKPTERDKAISALQELIPILKVIGRAKPNSN